MRTTPSILVGSFLFGLGCLPGVALADDAPIPAPTKDAGGPAQQAQFVVAESAGKRPPRWTAGIALGGTFNLLDSRNVVGQQDGTALSLGAAVDAELDFNKGIHEWRNSLKLAAGATRTPSIGEFVKTTDGATFESIYLLHALEWLGPFARVAVTTNMFPSLDVRPAAVDYLVTAVDGTTTTTYTGRRLHLTDAFKPTTFKQSIGAFTQPVKNDHITFEGRLGLGAQEALADGQLALADDATTPQIEVQTLQNFSELGVEGVANAWGFIDNSKRVSYTVGVGVLVPFAVGGLKPELKDDSDWDLTNVEVHGGLNVHIFDWASLDYKLAVLRQPLLVSDVQVSNMLLLTIGAAFGSKAPAPPPPPCDCTKTPAPPAATTPGATAPADATPPAANPEPAPTTDATKSK